MKKMSDTPGTPACKEDDAALATPFVKCLTRLIRAQDTYGSRDGTSDAELLAHFIVSEQQRRTIPIIGDPDPDVLLRINIFYTAVGLTIEGRTGLVASPTMMISNEGFGRVLLTTGRLVVFSKTLRDVHRFGFATLRKLAEAGAKLVDDAIAAIEAYPDVARE
ncbi:NifX-associated nitrogen fixation protein [Sinorhizobium sp. 7-81]|uniref:NifX-associated nitrogen fixation protein n=1 Tax=unclassified Sinorhizobium TaxID=2613772 RepID=UPI0024C33ECF|nr:MULTISPECIES: NifX-associated nitrogen fixation protein [unclassified Sinorhizobium]MDK1389275.1 NifX-associated nitrogen fixation protein [Sinorhizobium sp. 7-81]MDK1493554.1 NifX-associated nitrogen fixation protein [Sinorhizobium sp. 8-89]